MGIFKLNKLDYEQLLAVFHTTRVIKGDDVNVYVHVHSDFGKIVRILVHKEKITFDRAWIATTCTPEKFKALVKRSTHTVIDVDKIYSSADTINELYSLSDKDDTEWIMH